MLVNMKLDLRLWALSATVAILFHGHSIVRQDYSSRQISTQQIMNTLPVTRVHHNFGARVVRICLISLILLLLCLERSIIELCTLVYLLSNVAQSNFAHLLEGSTSRTSNSSVEKCAKIKYFHAINFFLQMS